MLVGIFIFVNIFSIIVGKRTFIEPYEHLNFNNDQLKYVSQLHEKLGDMGRTIDEMKPIVVSKTFQMAFSRVVGKSYRSERRERVHARHLYKFPNF